MAFLFRLFLEKLERFAKKSGFCMATMLYWKSENYADISRMEENL